MNYMKNSQAYLVCESYFYMQDLKFYILFIVVAAAFTAFLFFTAAFTLAAFVSDRGLIVALTFIITLTFIIATALFFPATIIIAAVLVEAFYAAEPLVHGHSLLHHYDEHEHQLVGYSKG